MPVPKRVTLLMKEMTHEEKMLQLVMADIKYGVPPPRQRWNQTEKVLALVSG